MSRCGPLDIGIVGGGINGMCAAWLLAEDGHQVTVYERDVPMSATSSASSKLLHGGLRYLENLEFRLVREALKERDAWFRRCPKLAKPLQLIIPVYRSSQRGRWLYGLGLSLYNCMANSDIVQNSQWHSSEYILTMSPGLKSEGLIGAYSFWDGQMDDQALGLWVTEQALSAGIKLKTGVDVQKISVHGDVVIDGNESMRHQRLINVAGPWAERLATKSGVHLKHQLDLVRGSHMVLRDVCKQAMLLEMPGEKRIFFVLPWQGKTLVGTTEVRQDIEDQIMCSAQEQKYLQEAYSHYFPSSICEVEYYFAGLRPLVKSAVNPSQATREYVIEKHGRLLTVLGGKWTTSMALARKIKEKVIH